MVKPLNPDEALRQKETVFPDAVIQAINNLLKAKFTGSQCKLTLNEVETEIAKIDESLTHRVLYDKGWLDFEPIFRQHGWAVSFDSPVRDESFDSYYTFKRKS